MDSPSPNSVLNPPPTAEIVQPNTTFITRNDIESGSGIGSGIGRHEHETTQSNSSTESFITESEFGVSATQGTSNARHPRPLSIRPNSLDQHLENLPINQSVNLSSSFYDGPTFEELFPELTKQKKTLLYYANPRNAFTKKPSLKEMNTICQLSSLESPQKKTSEPTPALDTKKMYLANLVKHSSDEIKQNVDKIYHQNNPEKNNSNSLDILAIYIRGQKILYTEAKTYCEQQLNFLMLPAIFISCVSSIFSLISTNYAGGSLIIAGMNGFNSFLLALISYLKLDAKAQAHKTSAYKFDKLESICEFNSGKFMFFDIDPTKMIDVIISIENDVREIKETNQFILPESIRHRYPITYSTNIFSVVKKIQSVENICIETLSDILNKLEELKIDIARWPRNQEDYLRISETIEMYEKKREQLMEKIFYYRGQYFNLDQRFNEEIRYNIKRQNQWFITRFICCDWLKS